MSRIWAGSLTGKRVTCNDKDWVRLPPCPLTINRQALKAVKENKADKDRTQGELTSNASPRLTNKTKCVEGKNKGSLTSISDA